MKKILFLLLPLLQLADCSSADRKFSEKEWRERIESKDRAKLYAEHVLDNRYFNPWKKAEDRSYFTFLKWRLSGKGDYSEYEEKYLPAFIPNAKERIRETTDKDFIFWIGHSTFLIRINGEYWLTDPVFSERALFPKRRTRTGVSIPDIKELTDKINVVITHNHYDHLDEESIRNLPAGTRFFVPLGLKKNISKWHKGRIFEMDWWQSIDAGTDLKLLSLPAQHWSNRIGEEVNESLWSSFLLVTPSVKIFFGCDSGYFTGFKEIGEKFEDIDYAILSTGAYMPRWLMHYMHMDIKEAIDAFKDLGARFFIPSHWGTFTLGDEPAGYPSLDLQKKITDMKLDKPDFKIMNIGEILLIE